jgi:predicted glycogen debranching enzyme
MTLVKRFGWQRGDSDPTSLLTREWLVTNGLAGYAAGTIAGSPTRRYHGLLVAALPNPLGRTMMLNELADSVTLPDGTQHRLGGSEREGELDLSGVDTLREFWLEDGLPVWRFEFGPFLLEKRVHFAYLQNTVFIDYRLLEGEGQLRLALRPSCHFRPHDAAVSEPLGPAYSLSVVDDRFEISTPLHPPLRLWMRAHEQVFATRTRKEAQITYRVEADRGYAAVGEQWTFGQFEVVLTRELPATLIASTDSWETMTALTPDQARAAEKQRRAHLVERARVAPDDAVLRELVMAADQFVVFPRARVAATALARARGEDIKTIIAGYHWFTDWGRDTMISLEGLVLQTGRHAEARAILRMFAHYAWHGLIPNMFPEGTQDGLYHTADATLWFFHAVDRYARLSDDRQTLRELLPVLEAIVAWHVRGTDFGIGVDPADGLLRQGRSGYQLTWMDAKCDGWVVTPRRGKAVEINALWYNALRNLQDWIAAERGAAASHDIAHLAQRVERSFNARFWCADKQYLYDVVDGEVGQAGNDDSLRPNQLFSISLPHPVLARERWPAVFEVVTRELLTPVGLRSLARSHPDYKPNYHGDLRTRDAAYHQGTVWSWLIGPYVDALLKLEPEQRYRARAALAGLVEHLDEACVGSVSEVFDAEAPFVARGCVAQAWGVAELLRAWRMTQPNGP